MYTLAIAIIIVAIIILVAVTRRTQTIKAATHDGYVWNVSNYADSALAAELLSRCNRNLLVLMGILAKKYHISETDDTIQQEGNDHYASFTGAGAVDKRKAVESLLVSYNPDVIAENDPRGSADSSYTIGKGASMFLCLRSRDPPYRLADDNTVMFTILHECAHIANYDGFGHGPDFWEKFKFLLREAVDAGIYVPVNYDTDPVMFCGVDITYQPLHDAGVRDL